MSTADQPNDPQLDAASAQILDQFIEARATDHTLASDPTTQSLTRLLALLDTPVAAESQRAPRIDYTALSVRRSDAEATEQLSELDQRALDQWIESGCDLDTLESTLQPRGKALESLRTLAVDSAPANPAAKRDLIDRTLARIQAQIDAEEAARAMPIRGKGTMRLRLSDLISLAAMLLIAGSIALPMFNSVQQNARQVACLGNLDTVAEAFGTYANANRDTLPMATAGFGPTWMKVGSTPEQSNSANLYTLVRTDHATLSDLACPSNEAAQTGDPDPDAWDWKSIESLSYSYRIMPRGGFRVHDPAQPVRVVVMSDRSPVTLRAIRGVPIIPEENSPNHNYAGQHILKLDGSTQWLSRPVLESNDNLWLPRPIEQVLHQVRNHLGIIEGNEQPDGPADAFVGP
ncbi:MAG: hypothetical protein KC996_07535 [Phycisphaerales bacterium]|nr:hypothetical protein [Phycisphaerales bacterium]